MSANNKYAPGCSEPVATGLLDLRIAAPAYAFDSEGNATATVLIPLGTATDTISVSQRPYLKDIHSDRNGGQEGPPSEIQYLGEIINISLALQSWNTAAIAILRRYAVNATRGTILQAEVGAMMLKSRSIRLLINTADTVDIRNFWCCLVRDPQELGIGTKWSEMRLNFTAYRPPCYHPKANIIEDQDITTGWPS